MHTVLIATLLWSVYVHDRELRGPDCDSTRSVYVHGRDLRCPDRDCTRSVCIHDVFDFCRGRHRSPAQQAKSALRQELFWIAKSMPKTVAASPSEPVVFIVAPDPAAAQETDNLPETVPAPHSNFDAETIAELKGKLREAVAVANGCHRALQREEAQADAEIKRLQFHLQLERAAHMKTRTNPRNPTGASIIPTPEEAQHFVEFANLPCSVTFVRRGRENLPRQRSASKFGASKTLARALHKILQRPGMPVNQISVKAMQILLDMMHDLIEKVMDQAATYADNQGRAKITSKRLRCRERRIGTCCSGRSQPRCRPPRRGAASPSTAR